MFLFTALQKSFLGSIIGSILLFFPAALYAYVALYPNKGIDVGARFLAKEFGRFLINELPNMITIITFMAFVAIFTKFAAVFFATLALLLIYVCIKAVAYREELRRHELPECFKNDTTDMFIRFWRQLTFCACLALFDLLLFIGNEFARHSQVLH